ncbi:recombinase family protein [Lyngbya sp. PCC 8106]|uniref:recombinase family protein n=1 Tax=Lyngbya sp. (strain PCC 8106) TaxID=313612 RepID=UPI0000EA9A2A|nr:recombinase family protein [Lyngbya sp. PCC 8106]EAW34097.1 Recombinase [Lyngbya sp. PCC 8106]
MKIIAYSYSDPLLETPPNRMIWGWEIDQVYQDLGERQQLDQLFADCEAEPTEYLLIRRFEELGDNLKQVSDRLLQLEALNVKIIAIESNLNRSISDATQVDLIKLIAEIQTSQRSRRIRQGHARNRIKATPPPGKAPYGYRRGKERYTLDRTTAPVVKEFFERFLIYGSLRGAVRYLEKRYSKKISVTTGRRWLTNPVYRGDLEYKNGETILNTHVAILSREEAAQIDRLLRRNQRMSPKTASAPRSLAGLVFCGECSCLMTVSRVTTYRKNREYLYLRPTACPRQPKCKALSYNNILDATIQHICENLPRAVSELKMPNLDKIKIDIQHAIATKQEILSQLPQLTATGILDEETTELRIYKLKTEIAQLQGKFAQFPPVSLKETAQAVSIQQFWLDLSETERRFYFREFIRKIEIIRPEKNWKLNVEFIF